MKNRKRLIALALVVVAGVLGLAAWLVWRESTAPSPPHVPLEGVQKEKAERIEQALERVRREPRGGEGWGELGMTLLANGFPEECIPCFEHAHRFDPAQPKWPYFQGAIMLMFGRRD